MSETQGTLIQSVQRALRLVEAISANEGRATAKELARTTGFSLSTTYHLLRTLAHEGYVSKLDDGTYVLGHAITTMANQNSFASVLARVRPAMTGLRDELKAPVYFALYDEGEISVVEIAESAQVPGIDLWVGIHESAHATAIGKSILAALDEESRSEYLSQHPMHALTRKTVTNRQALEAQIATKGSVARDDGEYLTGVRCVAHPVITERHLGTVGVALRPGSRRGPSDEEVVSVLATGAGRIARALNFSTST